MTALIQELFQDQAHRTPRALAVGSLTYGELDARANQFAHYLTRLGVGPERPVGLGLEPGPEMIVGLLGLLKAGAPYVPLDPTYPRKRLDSMIQDARLACLVTRQGLPAADGVENVCLDRDRAAIARESEDDPDRGLLRGLGPDSLAYIIFTSGSTGRPKGVGCTHRGVLNLLADFEQRQPLEPGWLSSGWTSLSFDVSVYEIFSALLSGGELRFPPEAVRGDPTAFAAWLEENRVRNAYLPPFMLGPIADGLRRGDLTLHLRRLLVGVEPIAEDILADIARLVPGLVIVNGYGPTETTVCATLYTVPAEETSPPSLTGRQTPIGRPAHKARVYLLGLSQGPVPNGEAGEVYVGGEGLARGYVDHPDLTAERFLPDPFSPEPGARFYRTGDLARLRPDGNLEFVGRLDHQVKIRGFRVELGEIDAALLDHPGVERAVTVLREDRAGDKRLVAYVVPMAGGPAVTPADLRSSLLARLPEWMMPSAYVIMAALPIDSNGKVDRRALPAPGAARPELGQAFEPARNPVEEVLVTIWAEALGLERVGINDDFLALGGHSLLATRVVSRARDILGVELPVRTLFENPTVARLAGLIEAARAGLIEAARAGPIPGRSTLAPRLSGDSPATGQAWPLSPAQRRLWFLDQMSPGTPLYNIPGTARLRGPLDVDALERTLNEIVQRHEALRTTFRVEGRPPEGEPVQVVAPFLAVPLPVIDLRGFSPDEPETEARGLSQARRLAEARGLSEAHRLAEAEARRPFDLGFGPLVRAGLFRLADQDHLFVLVMHHIVSDGWSLGVLMREIATLYEAFASGRPSPLPALSIQYADFTRWQADALADGLEETQLAYWTRKLAGLPPLLALPTDRPRPAVLSDRGALASFTIPDNVTEGLRDLCRREGLTLFMVFLAAFQVLLHRYTGQSDLAVGVAIANRTRADLEDLVGFFVNTLVVRADLSGNPTFREYLTRVRQASLEAYAHQDLPFERLVRAIRPERSLGHMPLVQVLFAFQNMPMPALKLAGVTVSEVEIDKIDTGTAKADLVVTIEELGHGFGGTLQYSTDLFEAPTIGRLIGHFRTLLAGIVEDPGRPLTELPLLDAGERRLLLEEWNDTRREGYDDQCVHTLFDERAAHAPLAAAVACGDETLTYAELASRANRLARYLKGLGVGGGGGSLVGVCLERSVDLVVSLLGILKAGGAYVPLDPDYPGDRLAFMLEDTRAPVLLTQESLLGNLPLAEGAGGPVVVCLDRDREAIARESDAGPPEIKVSAEDLAYVTYTSGSTGRPKGVAIPHRGVVRLVKEANFARLSEEEVFLQFAPVSFDASTLEIWGALLSGGRLEMAPPGMLSLGQLGEVVRRRGVTTLWLTAGLFNAMVEDHLASLTGLGQLLFGGDVASGPHVRRAWRGLPGCRLINGYGPTENTTFTCCYTVPGEEAITPAVPIGRPVTNTTVYILDQAMRPAPVGVPGELYTGGDGLARGYLNRPAETAEKFGPDPFSSRPGARLYQTGDLARYLPDGNIEFLGRRDQQVKIRGFRIELGEIETALLGHPALREAVVVAGEDQSGGRRLVAYVVRPSAETGHPAPDASAETGHPAPDADELRSFLAARLPGWMVPAGFVFLDRLPLGPTGKVDHAALPAPEAGSLSSSGEKFRPPRTSVERAVASVWAGVLKVDRIGLDDDFFALGGHSLLAAQVIGRMRESLGVELSVRRLFETPTVAGLSRAVEEAQARASTDGPLFEVGPIRRRAAAGREQLLKIAGDLDPDELAALLGDAGGEEEPQ